MSEPTNRFYSCPVELTLDLLAGKGKPSLLRHLAKGVTRSGDLERSMPLTGSRMIDLLLADLVRDGLVERTVQAEIPLRVEYMLKAEGRKLAEMLEAMAHFGERYASGHQIELLTEEETAEDQPILSRSVG